MLRTTPVSILFALIVLLWTQPACAGGGPEYVLLVVNKNDPSSKTVANYYVEARQIPANNVLYLDWKLGDTYITVDQFRDELLSQIFKFLAKRKLIAQIDCIVYSSGFPYGVNFSADIPPQLANDQYNKFSTGSLTGLTFLYRAVLSKDATKYGGRAFHSNFYMRLRESKGGGIFELPIMSDGQYDQRQGFKLLEEVGIDPTSVGSHGFRNWYGWGPRGELLEAGGMQYALSAMLGVTSGRGNTVGEIVRYLRDSPPADGSYPRGTIYFMDNAADIRSTTRRAGFEMAVDQLDELGVKAQIVPGVVPQLRADVQGLLTGAPIVDWQRSGSSILRGAICENLTSYGAIFDINEQTPCTEFLKYGATGTSGTVAEPYAQQAKFPHAMIQVHYARGCDLVEAFYQSIYMPYQLLILGDPLCRPWANIPKVKVDGIEPQKPLSRVLALKPSATLPRGGECDRFELVIDGQRLAACAAGGTLEFDSAKCCDGYHQIRVVGFERSPIETQGVATIDAQFNNFGRTLEFAASPLRISGGRKIHVSIKCADIDGVVVYHNGQTIATIQGENGTADIDSVPLGDGPVTLSAMGWKDGREVVAAQPIKLLISNGLGGK
ncbi:MAG: hypothetical protein IT427_10335 [Pirellulales bacterium]|nr:hypothetical protein [Pirellulales bacterium]